MSWNDPEKNPEVVDCYHSMVVMTEFSSKSPEELRLEDYARGNVHPHFAMYRAQRASPPGAHTGRLEAVEAQPVPRLDASSSMATTTTPGQLDPRASGARALGPSGSSLQRAPRKPRSAGIPRHQRAHGNPSSPSGPSPSAWAFRRSTLTPRTTRSFRGAARSSKGERHRLHQD